MIATLSTVTPVYQGENYLEALVTELAALRLRWQQSDAPVTLVEAIFVDDGSIDESGKLLSRLAGEHSWLTVVTLSKNVGQHSATAAGICHSSADWVVTLDEDLQHRPADIETMLVATLKAGADICYALPEQPSHGGSWRDRSSSWVKSAIARMTNSPQIKLFNSFRLIRGSIARASAASSSSQTYLDMAIFWITDAYTTVTLQLKDQRFIADASSGYSVSKLIRHARHLLVSSSLDIASKGLGLGAIALLLAFMGALFVVLQKLLFPDSIDTVGWASLVAIVSFFAGVVITLLCIALEYLHVLVVNQLGKPTFFTVDRSTDAGILAWFVNKEKLELEADRSP